MPHARHQHARGSAAQAVVVIAELGAVEVGVEAAGREELVVGADLGDAPSCEDDDPVGAPDGREAVGDDERGAAGHEPLERLAAARLGLGVEGAGRLVEDQDRARP